VHRVNVFENKVLRRISGPKRDEIIGYRRKLQNYVHGDLYSSPNRMIKSRRVGWAGHVALMGVKRNAYRVLVGKSGRKETTIKTKT
jgi:hypothetical protein